MSSIAPNATTAHASHDGVPGTTGTASANRPATRAIARTLATGAGWAPLALRVPVGIVLAAHGSQKLFGWFGGYGLEGTGQFMDSLGLHPGYLMALLAGSAEFFGGLALLVGLLTRPAAALVAFTMAVAIFSVHIGNGLFASADGYEYALTLLAVAASLLFSGGGRLSLDRMLTARTLGARRS